MEIKRKWTVLVCLAGDNNLSGEMIYNIKEMKRVEKLGPNDPVTAIVIFDPAKGLPTQGYVINPGDEDEQLINESSLIGVVKKAGKAKARPQVFSEESAESPDAEISSVNTGDAVTLTRLISHYFSEYPADHYMLVLSGHGSGADEDFLLTDDGSHDSLSISKLKEVIAGVNKSLGRKIDILGLDSCLMSMAEVYYQLCNVNSYYDSTDKALTGNLVDFLIGSEGFVRSTGWPYQRILTTLTKPENKEITPDVFAEKIVEDYIRYYSDYTLAAQSVDIAVCDLREDNSLILRDKITELASVLTKNLKTTDDERNQEVIDAILLAHWDAQSYKFDQYTDLSDFCQLLAKRCKSHDQIKAACDGVVEAIMDNIVLKSCHTGPAVQYSFGLSVYFPWSRVSLPYQNLEFSKDTKWHEFLKEYVRETRRPPRNAGCPPEKFKKNSIKNLIFNPEPEEQTLLPNGSTPSGSKFVPSADMFVPSADMGQSNRSVSMKNPPVRWCPCECTKKEQREK